MNPPFRLYLVCICLVQYTLVPYSHPPDFYNIPNPVCNIILINIVMGYDFISGQRNVFISHRSKFISHLFCSKLTLDTLEQDVKYVRTIKTPE